jgi:hypothetical protein
MKMDYNEFKAQIVEEMENRFPDAQVSVRQQMKNNGVFVDALTVREKDSIIASGVLLNKYYEKMQTGHPFEEVKEAIIAICSNESRKETPYKADDIRNYEEMHGRIVFKVVSAEKNQELLKQIPHREVMDMAVIYYADVNRNADTCASFTVTNNMMENWGVKEPDLYQEAMKNAPVLMPASFKSMRDTLTELMPPAMNEDDFFDMIEHVPKDEAMYVLTNKDNNFGAAAMFYPGMLEKAAAAIQEDHIFILPSSVHEVLLVPDKGNFTSEELKEMVTEINATQVAPDEVLTDNVYEYDARKKELTMPLEMPKAAVMEEDSYDGIRENIAKPDKCR